MALQSHPGVQQHSPAWIGPAKFVLLVVAVISLYLLAESMVRHRFFSGGYLDDRIVHSGMTSAPPQ